MRFVMPTGLFKKAIPICVGAIILTVLICTLINIRETRKSADKIENAIKSEEESAPVINNNITVHGDYNNNINSYNNDNDTITTEEYNDNNNEDYWNVANESEDLNYDKCPRCGKHTYSFTYNSYDPSYSYASCDSCGYFMQ